MKERAMANSVRKNEKLPSIKLSNHFYNRAKKIIPCATQTLAKGPSQHVEGVAPKYLERGKGSHVWDVDGNEYLDYSMGIGPISLGYCFDRVDDAIKAQLENGITFSLMHPLEVEVAELINKIVPNAEAVRFSKTGADVTSAAIRLARAYTKKTKVLCCGYHGWHDWYISVTDRNAGIPQSVSDMTYTFNYNDIQSVIDSIDDDVAAIILEPFVIEEPQQGFLNDLREICTRHGIVLIFDEMWTGFRVALGGAQEYFGIKADLACFSKAVANGMPLSILTGSWDIMQLLENDVFFFTTFGGEALSLAAAKSSILCMIEEEVPLAINEKGKLLKQGINEMIKAEGIRFCKCIGFDCRSAMQFDAAVENPLIMKSYLQQELIRHGILWNGFHNISFSHSFDDILYTLDSYREIFPTMQEAIDRNELAGMLEGTPVAPVFRKTGNFNTKPRVAV
jgi:glutamate-1-semialdehyde aminotransferase